MIHSVTGPLPKHLYVWVDKSFIRKEGKGFEPAIWYGLVSHPGRMWGCTVMLECGAVYRNLPPHAIAFRELGKKSNEWSQWDAQVWNCYGTDFSLTEYPYFTTVRCYVRNPRWKGSYGGEVLFCATPVNDGFSNYPEQAKEFFFVKTLDGRLTIQPTDRLIFEETSFTQKFDGEWPKDLKRQNEVFSCE